MKTEIIFTLDIDKTKEIQEWWSIHSKYNEQETYHGGHPEFHGVLLQQLAHMNLFHKKFERLRNKDRDYIVKMFKNQLIILNGTVEHIFNEFYK